MFKKILIANRGEIALRIIRTCREMGIRTVAVYSTADRESLHVKFADEAVCIGPPPSRQSYLNIPAIISAAEVTGADAIHPGYGFLSENAEFSRICAEYGIKFIGATADQINAMGDKATAKATMKNSGVPVIPGSEGLIDTVEEAKILAKEIKYPVIIKATAGGGGRGMRIIRHEYVEEPRHIEIQIVGDQFGTVCHLSERDCSIQRRHQKLCEETPSPALTPELRERMGIAAVKGAAAIKYEGAGTVEFLLDKNGDFYFMEMNTRIQVEHPITEEVTNFDLIKEQIKVAAGIAISGQNYFPKLFALECRINAEDPAHGFRPSPGKITNLHLPGGHGVRIDSHVYSGYTIPPNYDSMIAKVIVTGQSREEVLLRMKRALQEFVIEGVKTTIPFHIKLMDDERFKSGNFTTAFMDGFDLTNL